MEATASQPHTAVAAPTHAATPQPNELIVKDDGPTPRKASWPPPPNPVAILSGIEEADRIRTQEIRGPYTDHVIAQKVCNRDVAIEMLLKRYRAADSLRAVEKAVEEPRGQRGHVSCVPNVPLENMIYRVGTPQQLEEGKNVEATLTWCSRRCEKNTGMPCEHMLQTYKAANVHELLPGVVHHFWREKGGEAEAEEEAKLKMEEKLVSHAGVEAANEGGEAESGWVKMSGRAHGAKGEEVEEAPTQPDYMDIEYNPVVPKGERYQQIVHEGHQLAALGRTSQAAFDKIISGMEKLYRDTRDELSKEPRTKGRPGAEDKAAPGPKSPRKVQTKGRKDTKRKKSALEKSTTRKKK
jgi:hypothetical protein